MAAKDLTGQVFFNWKVLKRGENIGKKPAWVCQCQCENKTIKLIRADHLKDGHCTSCGCLKIKKDIEGKQFGKLIALYPTNKRSPGGEVIWRCKCECGNEVDVQRSNLILKNTQSCGCLKKRGINITNQRFGKLIALYPTDLRNNRSIVWHCRCDCGNEIDVSISRLNNGDIKSCGCLKSIGQETISKILRNNNINFIQQKSFSSCRFEKTQRVALFDFYIPDQKYLIEYDGIQHFKENKWEPLKSIQERDAIKNQWCKENNIPLIRIPYTHLKDLCIEDLKLETSKFII